MAPKNRASANFASTSAHVPFIKFPVIIVAKQPCFLKSTTSATPALNDKRAMRRFWTLLPAAATGVGAADAAGAALRRVSGLTRGWGPRQAEARARPQRTLAARIFLARLVITYGSVRLQRVR